MIMQGEPSQSKYRHAQLVSVIVTCYNQEKVIAETIRSVTMQTYSNLECIVVDDGSEDHSVEVICEITKTDSRVSLLSQRNQGVSAARNAGFARAKGEFIQFLDGDDLLSHDKLDRQLSHFEAAPRIDVSYTKHQFLDRQTELCSVYEFEEIAEYPLEQFLFKWLDGISLPIHAPLYRRHIWQEQEKPFPEDYHDRCEDWIFLVTTAQKNARFAPLDEVLCTYCVNHHNYTSNPVKWNADAVMAAIYLENRIPVSYRAGFVRDSVERALNRYLNIQKPEILRGSKNWQLGNLLTRPVFKALAFARRLLISRRRRPSSPASVHL